METLGFAGDNRKAFGGWVAGRALKPAEYRLTLTARNAVGRAKPVSVRFTIVRCRSPRTNPGGRRGHFGFCTV